VSARCADLHAFADGELPEDEVKSFREHLAGCSRCQDELEGILALRALVETMGDPPAPKD
jgi:anti-sigma factor RsiW